MVLDRDKLRYLARAAVGRAFRLFASDDVWSDEEAMAKCVKWLSEYKPPADNMYKKFNYPNAHMKCAMSIHRGTRRER